MKKKLLLAGAMLLLAVAAVTGFAAYERANMSDLMDANVEALARNEDDKNGVEVSAICPNCGEEYTDCLHCIEDNCGSCTPEEHTCPM